MPRPSVEAERREQILRATCLAISDRGYRGLRVRDVATRVGTSTGTIHYYFGTKRDLVLAAFEYNFSHSIARRRDILDAAGDPATKLSRLVESYLPRDAETVLAWRVWADIWAEGLREPLLRELNERVYGEWRQLISTIIAEGQAREVFVDGDPVQRANALIAMIDGLALQVILGSDSMSLDQAQGVVLGYVQTLRPTRPACQ